MKTLLLTLFSLFTLTVLSQETECTQKFAEPSDSLMLEEQVIVVNEISDCHTIRVVVHVVYNSDVPSTSIGGNISEAQVKSQIRIANQFFRNDSLMYHEDNTPLGYILELATTDPYGNATTGIVYHDGFELFGDAWSDYGLQNNNPNGVSATELANAVGWGEDANGKKYINSYVVPEIDGTSGGGVQAYAYFPTNSVVYGNYNLSNTFGSADLEGEDDFFVLKTYTNRGLTWPHELLHNFAIFHVFQGNSCEVESNPAIQGDRVQDTPPQTKGVSCSGACGFVSYNVMDYLSESCKNLITIGQAERANLAIQASLQDYLVCADCDKPRDFNGDGYVNVVDVSLMNVAFGCSEGDACYDEMYDLNCDGFVNILDVSMVNFGTTIIEPSQLRGSNLIITDITGRQVLPSQINKPGVYIVCTNEGICTKTFISDKWLK